MVENRQTTSRSLIPLLFIVASAVQCSTARADQVSHGMNPADTDQATRVLKSLSRHTDFFNHFSFLDVPFSQSSYDPLAPYTVNASGATKGGSRISISCGVAQDQNRKVVRVSAFDTIQLSKVEAQGTTYSMRLESFPGGTDASSLNHFSGKILVTISDGKMLYFQAINPESSDVAQTCFLPPPTLGDPGACKPIRPFLSGGMPYRLFGWLQEQCTAFMGKHSFRDFPLAQIGSESIRLQAASRLGRFMGYLSR